MNEDTLRTAARMYRPYAADYWNRRFSREPYFEQGDRFEDFEPAYRFGHSLQGKIDDFDLRVMECEKLWEEAKMESKLAWARAKHAARAAWRQASEEAESKLTEGICRAEKQLRAVAHCTEETLKAAYARLKVKVRERPGEYLLGTLGAGYVAGRVPLRSVALSGLGLAAAAALVLWGVYKAADHILGLKNDAAAFPGRRAILKEGGDASLENGDE
jgi:hypothetical protein